MHRYLREAYIQPIKTNIKIIDNILIFLAMFVGRDRT